MPEIRPGPATGAYHVVMPVRRVDLNTVLVNHRFIGALGQLLATVHQEIRDPVGVLDPHHPVRSQEDLVENGLVDPMAKCAVEAAMVTRVTIVECVQY